MHSKHSDLKPVTGGLFKGADVVFTGELEHFTRDQASELLRKAGGRLVSSVTQQVDFVVVGRGPA